MAGVVARIARDERRHAAGSPRWHVELRREPGVQLLVERRHLADLKILSPAADQGVELGCNRGAPLRPLGGDNGLDSALKALDSLRDREHGALVEAEAQKI